MKADSRLLRQLQTDIITGKLPPGTRLDELSLADRFGVSRTPVREALLQLRAIGLVESEGKKGTVVSAPAIDTVIEMFETMSELEAVCGSLAARRMQADDRDAVLAAHDACADALRRDDKEAFYEGNAVFHRSIFSASRNRFLADQAAMLHQRLAPLRALAFKVDLKQSHAEHQRIVDALLSGDCDRTAQALREHSFTQGSRFSDFAITLSSMGFRAR